MATQRRDLAPEDFQFLASAFPQYKKNNGTNMPRAGLYYDATTSESAHCVFKMVGYGSGDVTVSVDWYADTATSGGVVWEAAISALTPNTDTQDAETDAYATAVNATDTHLGTVGQREHTQDLVLTGASLDSLANLDRVSLRIARLPANAGDTMTGDAVLTRVVLSYSDV